MDACLQGLNQCIACLTKKCPLFFKNSNCVMHLINCIKPGCLFFLIISNSSLLPCPGIHHEIRGPRTDPSPGRW